MGSPRTTTYLFAGDSLTEGTYGENYVDRVAKVLYHEQFGMGKVVNGGRAGDTVKALLGRIDELLDRYLPQWVILSVGVNDVCIPWLARRSFYWWLWAHNRRIRLGQTPATDLDQFGALYRALIDKVQQAGAQTLVCTTSPVGEQIASPLNHQLARLNGVIKHVAADQGVPVADVWSAFVQELAPLEKPSRYTFGEWLFIWLDGRRLRSKSPDELAERRRLLLTFDGAHLNSRGADLWAYVIVNALARAQGTVMIDPEPAPGTSPSLLGPPSLLE